MLLSRLKTLTSVAVLALASVTAHAADPIKAGFVYIGPTGDHGWTYSHDVGRKVLEGSDGLEKRLTPALENMLRGALMQLYPESRAFAARAGASGHWPAANRKTIDALGG